MRSHPFLIFSYLLFVSTLLISTTSCAQTKQVPSSKEIKLETLNTIIEANRKYTNQGEVADYIPELSKANPEDIAIAVVTKNGEVLEAGDSQQTFTIQSISKLIGLMLAVEDHGEEKVFQNMGYFGTSKPFNHFANLEADGIPLNPMMNAGAILTTALVEGDGEVSYERILERIRYITKNKNIKINEAVYLSEKETGDRNRGIFYLLKNNGWIEGEEEEEKLDNYFRQCAIEVSVTDLAKIGYYFANQCIRFDGDTTYKNADMSTLIQSQMLVAGMYDYSGEYARTVGLPSKSGVGGGISVSVPNQMGIGVYSPGLDAHGNSAAGHQMIKDLAKEYCLSLFD